MLNLKNQKGSITFFVLSSCLFFIASVAGVFMYMQSKQVAVDREYRQIKNAYEGNIEEDINGSALTIEDIKENGKLGDVELETVKIKDGDGVTITIPAGFTVTNDSPNNVSEGIVITDSVDDNGNSIGNEFVWIPINYNLTVVGTNKLIAKSKDGRDENNRDNYEGILYDFSGNGDSTTSTPKEDDEDNYREPDTISIYDISQNYLNIITNILTDQAEDYKNLAEFKQTMQEDYNEMIESIKKYGGFYVSRYEMGKKDNRPISKKGTVTTAFSSKCNFWYGLYATAKNYKSIYNSVESSMVWGSQWDAILNYALTGNDKAKVNVATNGNHSGNPLDTGSSSSDKIINIYDLEGNYSEWTLEAKSQEYRTRRGGCYVTDANLPSTSRNATAPDGTYDYYASRFTLFIKENPISNIKTLKEAKENGILTKNTEVIDDEEIRVTIPAGFAVSSESPTKAIDGIIITDNLDNDRNSIGNEFVWIPINEDLKVVGTEKPMAKLSEAEGFKGETGGLPNYEGVLYNFIGTGESSDSVEGEPAGEKTYGQETSGTTNGYREPDVLKDRDYEPESLQLIQEILEKEKSKYTDIDTFKKTMQEDYNKMIQSVKTYGGFYVSRYEMGLDSNTKNAISKKVLPISSADSEAKTWYGLYARAKTYTNRKNSVVSSMIWGSQYDAMLNYALTGRDKEKVMATGNGYYTGDNSSGSAVTGTTETDKIINIYDLESNMEEWTEEACETECRCARGNCWDMPVGIWWGASVRYAIPVLRRF